MRKVLITSAFQLPPFRPRLHDFFFNSAEKVSHADNNQEQSHRPPIHCRTHARPVGSGNKPVPHSMFYFYNFLWSVRTPASYYKTPLSGAHFSIVFIPQISGIFSAAKTEAHFHLKTGSGGLEGKTKASVEACISVLACVLNPNKPLPLCAASFSCCSNGCFTRAWWV